MNKKLSIILYTLAIIAGLLALTGCSDDGRPITDLSSGSELKEPGDALDAAYIGALEVRDWVNENIEIVIIQALWIADNRIKGGAELPGLGYDSVTGYWHYFKQYSRGLREVTEMDSVQFFHGEDIVQWPDSAQLTEIRAGSYWSWTDHPLIGTDSILQTGVEFIMTSLPGFIAGYGDVLFEGQGFCRGHFAGQVIVDADQIEIEADMDVNLTDLTMTVRNILSSLDWPYSGTIEITGSVNQTILSNTVLIYSDIWNIVTFYNTTLQSISVENSKYFW